MHYNNQVHFLQSSTWKTFHESLGHTVLTDSGEGWSYLAVVEKAHGIKRLYCPYGPTIESEAALPSALAALRQAAKSTGAAYARVQPLGADLDSATRQQNHLSPIAYSQPSHTWTIDLRQPVDDLLADMKQTTRSVVRNYHKKGLVYRASQDPGEMAHLLRLLHQVASHNQISLHSDSYLTTQADSLMPIGAASLHFIEYESEIIAAALTYQDDSTVYYAHAAADYQHRKLNASTALVGEILLRAKAAGKIRFDLFGVTTSDDPDHRWAGFTKFKQSFGGQLLPLSQTYEMPVNPLLYHAYRLARKILRK